MSTEHDDPQSILTDFLTWVRQNESAGMEWFLDEGSAAAVEPEAVPTDPFDEVIARFVAETLPLIKIQPPRSKAGPAVGDKGSALAELRDEVLPCTACALHEKRNSTVFGSGSPDAEVVFIGEAPGRDEDMQGEPFVGRSGQLLTKILAAIGYGRDEVFICNILKCRPPNNRDPQPPRWPPASHT